MMVLAFTVPGEPQGKGRAKFGGGRTYTPAKTVSYEGLIALAAQDAMAGRPLMDGPLSMVVEAFMSVPASDSAKKRAAKLAGEIRPTKVPDYDNIAKAVSDACNGIAYRDDAQIVSAIVRKHYGETPGVRVTIQPIQGGNHA